jgi:hypothetical protein
MNEKVAILFWGTIGKKLHSVSNYGDIYSSEFGGYVNYKATFKSIKKYIIDVNKNCEFDFFSHLWCYDLKQNLMDLYNFKDCVFEDNKIYWDEINSKVIETQVLPIRFGWISALLSIKKGCELLKKYSENNNIKYDRVIIYRPDALLYKQMNLSEYNIKSTYCSGDANWGGDFHFVMSYENMLKFMNAYDYISIDMKPDNHLYLKEYVTKILNWSLNSDYIMDAIRPPQDQEILRKINTPIEKNCIKKEDIIEFGLIKGEDY